LARLWAVFHSQWPRFAPFLDPSIGPILLPFRDLPAIGRLVGYAGPPSRAAAEVVTKYIIIDMDAKAVQGMAAEEAVKS
jgi:hypothetical protein